MKGRTFSSVFLIPTCLTLLSLLLIGFIYYSKYKTTDRTFNLRKISAFKVDEKLLNHFVRGQQSQCNDQPDSEVRIYPTFQSDKPLYGSIRFAEKYGQKNSGILYHFALDESQGMGTGYNRLYFDLNRDLDLANDELRAPLKRPPKEAILKNPHLKQQICFHCLDVDFDLDSVGKCPLEIMPRLMIYERGYTWMSFVTTEAKKGKIKIVGQRYDVLLGHNHLISGSFNHPWTALHLIPNGDMKKQFRWQNADRLMAIHKIEGTYYCFTATPTGDQLSVRPYDGKLGTFMGGSGERDLTYIGCQGSLCSKDTVVAVGSVQENGWSQPSLKSQIPAGDYLPSSLSLQYDKLSIFISDNYHADGKPMSRTTTDKKYGIKIREGEPYVFDFSNEPEVMFASPARDCRIKLGEELTVKAILIDSELDIMIRRLTDLSRKEKKEYTMPDGQQRTTWREISLDPKVIITRADGEKVTEGVMPFG